MVNDIGDLKVFIELDYSQVEIRMLAECSKDELLISQFDSGEDIHCLVGNQLTGWPVEKIASDKVTRKAVKNFHFAIVFGVTEKGGQEFMEAKGVEMTTKQFGSYLKRYFQRYKGVARYIDQCHAKVEKDGYVETLFGFRREIFADESRHTNQENQAVNTPIQGTAHNLVLMAMAMLRNSKRYPLLQEPVMEIHDALFFLTRLKDLRTTYMQGKHLLEQAVVSYAKENFGVTLRVPLIAEATAGFCLGSMVDYTGTPVNKFLNDWRTKHKEVSSNQEILPADLQKLV